MQPNPIPAGTGMATGERSVITSMLRGAKLTCPSCGKGAMFRRYLKVADECPSCGEELHHHRADDAPPYFAIIIVGHVVVGLPCSPFDEWPPRPRRLWLHALPVGLPLQPVLLASLWLLPADRGRAGRPAMGASDARLRPQRRRRENRELRRRRTKRSGPLMSRS